MRVLITGASGFLGGEVAKSLACNHQVIAPSRQKTLPPGLTLFKADLAGDFNTIEWPDVDAIVHLAQSSRYTDFPASAGEVFAVAAGATQKLLDYAVRVGAQRFIFASTGGLYAQSGRPAVETDFVEVATGPIAHYLASKYAGELVLQSYRRLIDTTAVRIFFCYGPGQRPAMLIPRLAASILSGKPIRLQGENGPLMNPIFVTDAVEAIQRLVTGGGPDLVNLAGPRNLSLRDICEIIGVHARRMPIFENDPVSQAPNLTACIERLKSDVIAPTIDPDSGLSEVVRSLTTSPP